MFVRWKQRKQTRGYQKGQNSRYAVLVESYRDEQGRPRQRYIKHLGTITEGYETVGGHPIGFWKTADAALDTLDLTPQEREGIEAGLLAVVPRPDWVKIREELQAIEQRL